MEQYGDIYRCAVAKYSRVATAPSDTVGDGRIDASVARLAKDNPETLSVGTREMCHTKGPFSPCDRIKSVINLFVIDE
ncbi:hypothetical protein QQF64_013443, partial [Cirrhinus molitorella]